MNKVLNQDIQDFLRYCKFTDELQESSFLVTGATGLLGSTLIRCLQSLDKQIRIEAPVRNLQKAEMMFQDGNVHFWECDLQTYDYERLPAVDYIVHCAAPTASRYFVEQPVETVESIVGISSSLLRYAYRKSVKGFLFLSSLEVYGHICTDTPLLEEHIGDLSLADVRSSYPYAKRMVEHLCYLYAKEYGVNTKIMRLTQTTGAGIAMDDNRVIAQFVRLATQGKDIVLHTTGESARPYCYTVDAILAMLYILLRGKPGEAYNVANNTTFISALDLAKFIQRNYCPHISVKMKLQDTCYAPTSRLPLSTEKLESLGWQPHYSLHDIISRLIDYMRDI